MMGLYKVPFHDDESAATYCSRLAMANGVRAAPFCLDMGTKFADVINGTEESLQTLASVSGVDFEKLKANSVRRIGYGRIEIANERLAAPLFRATPCRVCVACLADDRSSSRGLSPEYFRLHWHAAAIQTCHIHGVEILDLGAAATAKYHDFAFVLQSSALEIHRAGKSPVPSIFTQYEQYVLDRMRRTSGQSALLDSIPLMAVVDICELVGAYTYFGKDKRLDTLSSRDWHTVSEIGYQRLRPGIRGFVDFLEEMTSGLDFTRYQGGGPSVFGGIHEKIEQRGSEPGYQIFREAMIEYAVENLALPADTRVFDRVINSGLISVSAANQPIPGARHHVRAALNYFAGRSDSSGTMFTREEIEATDRFLKEKVTRRQAQKMLGLNSGLFGQLLSQGLVAASEEMTEFAPTAVAKYSRTKLEELLRSLRIADPKERTEEMHYIDLASKIVCRPFHTLVSLVLEGKLNDVHYDEEKIGIRQVMVSPSEIKRLLKPSNLMDKKEVAAYIGNSPIFVDHLVRAGFLSPEPIKMVGYRNGWGFERTQITEFGSRYTTVTQLARQRQVAWQTVLHALNEAGVPAIPVAYNRVLFERPDAEAALGCRGM